MRVASLDRFYSVPELAEILSVKDDKVLHWISTGELSAFNAATNRGGRPRWRISVEAFEAFQAARAATPKTPVVTRRTRSSPATGRQWIK